MFYIYFNIILNIYIFVINIYIYIYRLVLNVKINCIYEKMMYDIYY